ncbi:UNVERIFIED_CONTAM: hypothetical protein GTU68_031112 [Idotea baltica]|nr:hypothetical protein [Idotea baltica]
MKKNIIILQGIVEDTLPNSTFNVKIPGYPKLIFCYIAGKLRTHFIKIVNGDKVKIEVSSYDLTKGRIVSRDS